MPTKVGAGGKPQSYGKGGLYAAAPAEFAPKNGANPEIRAAKRMEGYQDPYDTNRTADAMRITIGPDPQIRIRVGPEVFDRILADGRFKTQHETQTSGGMFSPGTRDAHEARMFGAEQTRPIYGYVVPQRPEHVYHNGQGQYGEVAVVLKPEIRDRTTVTWGDSLDTIDPPAPVPANHVQTATNERLAAASTTRGYRPSYIEAQIHDGVSVDDIDYIVVPKEIGYWNPSKVGYEYVSIDNLRKKYPGLKVVQAMTIEDEDGYEITEPYTILSVETLAARVL